MTSQPKLSSPSSVPHAATLSAGGATHEVINTPLPLKDYNLFDSDAALRDAVSREGAGHAAAQLHEHGAWLGRAETLALGDAANSFRPQLETHDRYGHRLDGVNYHPAYHALMARAMAEGLHGAPWQQPGRGAHVARAAGFYMQSEVEAGHGCPISMTFASHAPLQQAADTTAPWLRKIAGRDYDPRNLPLDEKRSATIGMGMTEKQGGSDVRANTTQARPLAGGGGPGARYALLGHKFFLSAPMCDAFLVLAQAAGGPSCFLVPRWRQDGRKNALELIRLKDKMGNVSNASAEVELRDAEGILLGVEGRGIANILDMVALTRFDCMIGSSAVMRMAVVQAIDHCRQRKAFGQWLSDQPLMQNVLADLALESEAALTFTMRLARALDERDNAHERHLLRLGAALGKFGICKRVAGVTAEAVECIGGSGVMETCIMPRLYREAPVNAIWEGSGNIQCLDVLRALRKSPETLATFRIEVQRARGGHGAFDLHIARLEDDLADLEHIEPQARRLVEAMSTALQASLLLQHAPTPLAEAYCETRLGGAARLHFGTLPRGCDVSAIIGRAAAR
ncbi:MAG: acyl-CoA dehydrogenase family protein [Hyphomicrobiales bacterium]|nr:acyl-CoA dehydrogenase family protein [Hyphomicrobiales bacterium]